MKNLLCSILVITLLLTNVSVVKADTSSEMGREKSTAVENKKIDLPELLARINSIRTYGALTLDSDVRICAEVNGEVYYSDYGICAEAREDIIEFPMVDAETKKVKVWAESKNGSVTETRELEIDSCNINKCMYSNDYNVGFDVIYSFKEDDDFVGPARSIGYVMAYNLQYGYRTDAPTGVSVKVNGKEYRTELTKVIGHSRGDMVYKYDISYDYCEPGSKLTFVFDDAHGCTYEREYTVQQPLIDYGRLTIRGNIGSTYVTAEIPDGSRLCVKIDEDIYYSDYSEYYVRNEGSSTYCRQNLVTVDFPELKESTSMSVWYESIDGSVSDKHTVEYKSPEDSASPTERPAEPSDISTESPADDSANSEQTTVKAFERKGKKTIKLSVSDEVDLEEKIKLKGADFNDVNIKYSIGDKNIAKVSDSLLTAKHLGKTTITAKCVENGKTITWNIVVNCDDLKRVVKYKKTKSFKSLIKHIKNWKKIKWKSQNKKMLAVKRGYKVKCLSKSGKRVKIYGKSAGIEYTIWYLAGKKKKASNNKSSGLTSKQKEKLHDKAKSYAENLAMFPQSVREIRTSYDKNSCYFHYIEIDMNGRTHTYCIRLYYENGEIYGGRI